MIRPIGDWYLSTGEAIAYCLQFDYPITRAGLEYLCKENNSMIKKCGHRFYDRRGLDKHLIQAYKNPLKGWVKLSSQYHLARNKCHFYSVVKASGIKIRTYGRNQYRYANEKALRRIFAKR